MTVTMAQTPASTPFSPAFRPNLEVFEKIVSSEKKKRKPPSKYVCPSPPLKSPFNSYGLPSTIYTPTARSLGTPQSVLTEERGDSPADSPHFEVAFENLGRIGFGSFGEVFKVRAHIDNNVYAIKRSRRPFRGTKDRKRALREVRAHATLTSHPHILNFIKAWEERGFLYIQTEYSCKGSLRDYLYTVEELPEQKIWNFLADLALALKHIHANSILHLDIKPSNIFLFENKLGLFLKVGDFGLATTIDSDSDTMEGDSCYMAPELLSWDKSTVGEAADVFSLGITLYEMAENVEIPSQHCDFYDELRGGKHRIRSPPYSRALQDLIYGMMRPLPEQRPSASQILQHPYIVSILIERNRVSIYSPYPDFSLSLLEASDDTLSSSITDSNISLDDMDEDMDDDDDMFIEPPMPTPKNLTSLFLSTTPVVRSVEGPSSRSFSPLKAKTHTARTPARLVSFSDDVTLTESPLFGRPPDNPLFPNIAPALSRCEISSRKDSTRRRSARLLEKRPQRSSSISPHHMKSPHPKSRHKMPARSPSTPPMHKSRNRSPYRSPESKECSPRHSYPLRRRPPSFSPPPPEEVSSKLSASS